MKKKLCKPMDNIGALSVIPVDLARLKRGLETPEHGVKSLTMNIKDFKMLVSMGCPKGLNEFAEKYKVDIGITNDIGIQEGYPRIETWDDFHSDRNNLIYNTKVRL